MTLHARLAALLYTALLLGGAARVPAAEAEVDADRFHTLTSELRCLVCQNESLADSNAGLAVDLKNEIRTRMAAGDSDDQIRRFLVDRYGDFVTYRPPVNARTLVLWIAPLLLLGGGGFALWVCVRPGRSGKEVRDDLDDEEHAA